MRIRTFSLVLRVLICESELQGTTSIVGHMPPCNVWAGWGAMMGGGRSSQGGTMSQPWSQLWPMLLMVAVAEVGLVPPGSSDSDCQEGEEELQKQLQECTCGATHAPLRKLCPGNCPSAAPMLHCSHYIWGTKGKWCFRLH